MSEDTRWRGRAMRANKGASVPRAFLFFDTETVSNPTNPDEQVLQFGCTSYVRWDSKRGHKGWALPQDATFWTIHDFWNEVEHRCTEKSTLWVMAHNLGGFDMNVVGGIKPLIDRGWTLDFAIIACPPFCLDFRKGTRRIRMVDSFNYYRTSLANMGKSVGLEKLADPYDPKHPPYDPDGSILAKRVEYCRRDVEILRRFMIEGWWPFVSQHDMGNWALTCAGQSFNAWRHRFAPKADDDHLDLWPTEGPASRFEIDAYHGGRTEAFYLGRISKPVWCYDANSMYPSVMLQETYPVEMVDQGNSLDPEQAATILTLGHGLICDVTVRVDRPLFPRVNVDDGRLEFPTGTFTTTLATPELRIALERGVVVRIGHWQRYRMEDLFSSFVQEWYRLRAKYKSEGNNLWADIVKLVLNSLYGKLGQREPDWVMVDASELPDLSPGEDWDGSFVDLTGDVPRVFRVWGPIVERKRTDEERTRVEKASPAVACHVTSAARVSLLRTIETAGWGHVFYCDTDSVFVDVVGRERLDQSGIIGDELGKWKLEKEDPGGMTIWGLKGYEFNGQRTMKGISKGAVEIAPMTFRQPVFRSFRGNIYHGTMGHQYVTEEDKYLAWNYTKGIPPEGEGWITPYHIEETLDNQGRP